MSKKQDVQPPSKELWFAISAQLAIILVWLTFPEPTSSLIDNTTVEYARGHPICNAVIRKIRRSQIFQEDHSFMLRLAWMETLFGHRNSTPPDYYGGIWKVDESMFVETLPNLLKPNSSIILRPLYDGIQRSFNIAWMSVTWKDLLKPLYSALASRLYLLVKTSEPIPDTINRQANYWRKYYRTDGEESSFAVEARILQNRSVGCRGKIDLCIGLDTSSSVDYRMQPLPTKPNFEAEKRFSMALIQSFSLDMARFGAFRFSNKAYQIFAVGAEQNVHIMTERIADADYTYGDSNLDRAIGHGVTLLLEARERNPGTSQVILLVTDGESSTSLEDAVLKAVENGMNIIFVEIWTGNKARGLNSSLVPSTNVQLFTLSSFEALDDFLLRMSFVLCTMSQKPLTSGEGYFDYINGEEGRYYTIVIPSFQGVTVFINVTYGAVDAYWSYEEAPFAAVNDGVMEAMTFVPHPFGNGSRGSEMNGQTLSKKDEETQKAYVTVFGHDNESKYLIYVLEGDHVGKNNNNETSSAGSQITASVAILILVNHHLVAVLCTMLFTTFTSV